MGLSTDERQKYALKEEGPNLPFSCSLSKYLLGDCLISGKTVIPRNYGVFRVHKDIVAYIFSQRYIQPVSYC